MRFKKTCVLRMLHIFLCNPRCFCTIDIELSWVLLLAFSGLFDNLVRFNYVYFYYPKSLDREHTDFVLSAWLLSTFNLEP